MQASYTTLRFAVGTRVECNCGVWEPGTIVKVLYRQSSFPPGTVAPYQIRLDNGKLIYAPIDEDRVIRMAHTSKERQAEEVDRQRTCRARATARRRRSCNTSSRPSVTSASGERSRTPRSRC